MNPAAARVHRIPTPASPARGGRGWRRARRGSSPRAARSRFPCASYRWCGNMLLYFYTEDVKECDKLVDMLGDRDPLGYGDAMMYTYKFKKFLCSCALGMKPAKPWDGLDEANGGYIIVKADGEILAYHIYNRNFFEQYLLDNTILERASTSRHDYMSLYEENGEMFIKLNLQIRFR